MDSEIGTKKLDPLIPVCILFFGSKLFHKEGLCQYLLLDELSHYTETKYAQFHEFCGIGYDVLQGVIDSKLNP